VPAWESRELAGLIPGARLSVMEAAPHGLNTERAQEFNQLVLDFIAEQAAVAG
jgi:pimeloyl-ACP methyl ester carboxylesterase